jgi:hypothetical protein
MGDWWRGVLIANRLAVAIEDEQVRGVCQTDAAVAHPQLVTPGMGRSASGFILAR